MFLQIAHLLIVNAFGLVIYALLLRFYMQWLRAPFRNPVGQLVAALTNWVVLPARRVIPGLVGIDLASVLAAWFLQALMLTLLLWMRGYAFASAPGTAAGLLFGLAAMELVQASLYLLIGVVIVHVLFSWFNPHSPLAPVLDALTRPFYAIFQRFVPPIGNVDFSPLFVLVIAQVLLIPIGSLVSAIEGPF
jgi:YggT family protein